MISSRQLVAAAGERVADAVMSISAATNCHLAATVPAEQVADANGFPEIHPTAFGMEAGYAREGTFPSQALELGHAS